MEIKTLSIKNNKILANIVKTQEIEVSEDQLKEHMKNLLQEVDILQSENEANDLKIDLNEKQIEIIAKILDEYKLLKPSINKVSSLLDK